MSEKVKISGQSETSVHSEGDEEEEDESEKSIFSKNLLNRLRLTALRGFSMKTLESDSETESEVSSTKSEDDQLSEDLSSWEEVFLPEELKIPTRKYIEKTVGEPLLYALSTLDRERPDNPIEFIAEYLLYYKSRADEEKIKKEEASKSSNPLAYYVQPKIKDKL